MCTLVFVNSLHHGIFRICKLLHYTNTNIPTDQDREHNHMV